MGVPSSFTGQKRKQNYTHYYAKFSKVQKAVEDHRQQIINNLQIYMIDEIIMILNVICLILDKVT